MKESTDWRATEPGESESSGDRCGFPRSTLGADMNPEGVVEPWALGLSASPNFPSDI